MTRRAKVPIYVPHVSEAIDILGGRASQVKIAEYICLRYPELVKPDNLNLAYPAVRVLRTRVSAILSHGKENGSFEIDEGEWKNLKKRGDKIK